MSSELVAQLVLLAYAGVAIAIIGRQIMRCDDGWRVWVLYVIERLYVGLWYHWRANRRCPFPDDQGALIIANHRSPVDPLFIWMNHHLDSPRRRIRVISFLTAREYYEKPGLHWICTAVQSIPVSRSGKDAGPTRDALRRLQRGKWIGVFPEGGIEEGEDLKKANPGVAWLALRSRAPVYPVFIHNVPPGTNMVEPFYTQARIRITYGDRIDLSRYYDRRTSEQLLEEVTDLMMSRLGELGGVRYQPARSTDQQDTVSMSRETG